MTRSMTLAAAVMIGTLSFSTSAFAQDNTRVSDGVEAYNQERFLSFTQVSDELRKVIAEIRAELIETKAKVIELWNANEDDQAARVQARRQVRALKQQAHAVRAQARNQRGIANQGQGQQIRQGQGNDNGRRIRGANGQAQNGQGNDNGRRIRGANGQGAGNGQGALVHASNRPRLPSARGNGNGQGGNR